VLESSATHYTIIALTLLDLMIVVTELILSSIFPAAEAVPHAGVAQRLDVHQTAVQLCQRLQLRKKRDRPGLSCFLRAYVCGVLC
jgi:hypothetical protein